MFCKADYEGKDMIHLKQDMLREETVFNISQKRSKPTSNTSQAGELVVDGFRNCFHVRHQINSDWIGV